MSNTSKRKQVWRRLNRGPLVRQQFVDSLISKAVAFQIREMRVRAGWSQSALAERCETSQNAISRLESPGYGKPSISTLKKVAAAFDVGLIVRFASFREIADWATHLEPSSIQIPAFDQENSDRSTESSASTGVDSNAPELADTEVVFIRADLDNVRSIDASPMFDNSALSDHVIVSGQFATLRFGER